MSKPNFKAGDLVLYCGGLFRVRLITQEKDEMGDEYYQVSIGSIVVFASDVRKADWRDVIRITKGGATK